jgi:hypothetical protein
VVNPWLEVLRSSDPRRPTGTSIPLPSAGLGLWADRGELLVQSPTDAAAFLRVVPDGDGFRVEPGRGGHGMHLNGLRGATQRLHHGDVFGAQRFVFRFLETEWPGAVDLTHEAALEEADDAGWAVYGDWLEERGARQAVLVERPTDLDEQVRWLWPLAIELQDARVDATFVHGRLRRLLVRDPMFTPVMLSELLALEHETRALAHLSWVEPPWVPGQTLEEKAEVAARDLVALGRPAALSTLCLGAANGWPGRVDPTVWRGMQRTFPRLTTTPATLFSVRGQARLVPLDEASRRSLGELGVLELHDRDSFALRPAGDHFVFRRRPPQLREDAVRLSHGADGWRVLAPLRRPGVVVPRLNGRTLPFFRLAPGDVVEFAPTLRLRFERV